ncbi:Aldose 1-epimerase [Toxocara canis]|uniref:Galactose mutarotase n=1 Tax=Toxocara canis TaxID=6265 RepID=A0A0B2W0Z5_TOXCA|nr:Aldose 1-epimerase [Toxocara canis]
MKNENNIAHHMRMVVRLMVVPHCKCSTFKSSTQRGNANRDQARSRTTDYDKIKENLKRPLESENVLEHELSINADKYLPVDETALVKNDGYINDDSFFGSTVGRVCNRIGYASFELDGKKYFLPANNGKHHLHGGGCLSKRVWETHEIRKSATVQSVKFMTVSRDDEFGYPGDVRFEVSFRLNDRNQLNVLLEAFSLSDANTIVNLTVHPYFNLDPDVCSISYWIYWIIFGFFKAIEKTYTCTKMSTYI